MKTKFCKYKQYVVLAMASCFVAVILFSCKKLLPKDREEIGFDSQYITTDYEPVLGRNTVFSNNFYKGSTSFPATFSIINPRTYSGDPAPELTDIFPVLVWKKAYDGTEKSLAEIDAKRTIENHQLFEVKEHSGEFVMWNTDAVSSMSNIIKTQPDSGYVFDVQLDNSGGRRYFKSLRLKPLRERQFEPSNVDPYTGQTIYPYGYATAFNVFGTKDRYLGGGDILVAITPVSNGNGHSLTFRFLDTLYKPINPNKFFLTNWNTVVHGFNMVKTDTSVTYDVGYPIPLAPIPTPYTTPDGKSATVNFSYSRLGFGGFREVAILGYNFNIYKKGDWLITFLFARDNPKFEDE